MEDLKKQLEKARFERTLKIVEGLATARGQMTATELARLNDIILGHNAPGHTTPDTNPWRRDPVDITLPSGKKVSFSVLTEPSLAIRDLFHRCTEGAEGGAVINAAVEAYLGIVKLHPFFDGNRRSAVIAAHYYLTRYEIPVSGTALYELGLGDARDPAHAAMLTDTIAQMAKFAAKRK